MAKSSTIREGLRALADGAHAGGPDPLDEYRDDVLATFDAGVSAEKLARFLTRELRMPISKDKVWRYVRSHGAKRRSPGVPRARAPHTDGTTAAATDELAPRRVRRRSPRATAAPPHQPSAKSFEL